MASNPAFEEALRLVLETSGTEGVEALRLALTQMGDVSTEAVQETGRLVDTLIELDSAAGKAQGYQSMLNQLSELEKQFDANQMAAYQLSLQLAETEKPSRELLNAQRQLASEGQRLRASLDAQWAAAERADEALAEAGVQTANLGKSQAILRERLESSRSELVAHTASIKREAEENERLRKSLSRMGEDLSDVSREFDGMASAVSDMARELETIDRPAKSLLARQQALGHEAEQLRQRFKEQSSALVDAAADTDGLADNTERLRALQQSLLAEYDRSADAIEAQAHAIKDEAEAVRRRNLAMEDADERFRRQNQSSRSAAEALKGYKERASQAAQGTAELGESAAATSSILNKLKGVAATAFGFIGFGKVVDGIKDIIKEGSDAEQELAQIQAALAATGRQSEFTAEQLARMRQQLQGGLFDDGQISAAQVRLLSYTNIVGKQFPEAMRAAIDQAQRLGMGLEQSAEVVGKALQTPSKAMESLSKQGFTLEDSQKQLIKQLEATGRVAEAQAIILDVLTESYGGAAAAAKVGQIAGLWKAATERFKDWKQEVADQGVLTYFKAQLAEMLDTVDRLAKDGTLTRWAKQTADGIITLANAAKGATQFVIDHTGAIVTMAKAYATFAIIKAIVQLNTWRIALLATTRAQWANVAAMDAAGKRAVSFTNVLKAIPRAVPITIGLLGLELAAKGLHSIGQAIGEEMAKNSAAVKQAGEFSRQLREELYRDAIARRELAVSLIAYRDTAVQTAEQLARLGALERDSYKARLDGLRQYLAAQLGYLLQQQELGLATELQIQQLQEVKVKLADVRTGYIAIADASKIAADAMRTGITSEAQLIIEKLQGIDRDSKLAASSIRELFNGLNFSDSNTLGNVGLALASIADQGAAANRNVRDGLMATLQQLSGEELSRFQAAATAAFESLPNAALNTATVLEQTLQAGLQKLGVSAEQMGVKFTAAGRDATAAFGAITENALATSAQIETAFKAALGKVATLDEARALGALLEAAGQRGKVGFDQAERSAAALNSRIREITNAMNPLNDEFGRLGIQSQASLNAARDSAKEAFEAIKRGASQGKASIEDVRRAFKAYADTARAAVADSDASAKSMVESQLDHLGAIYRVNDGLDEMGAKGASATQKVAAGAAEAASKLDGVAASASSAAAATEQVAAAGSSASASLGSASAAASGFSLEMGEISSKARELLDSVGGKNGLQQFAGVWNGLFDQRAQLAEYRKELEGTLQGFDELSEQRKALQSRFDLVGAGELEQVLQVENQIAVKQQERARAAKEAAAERLRVAEAEAKAQAEADAKRVGADGSTAQVVRVEWVAPTRSVVASASAADREQAERIADLVAPLVMSKLARSKSVSIRGSSAR